MAFRRATKGVDLLVATAGEKRIGELISALEDRVEFDPQVQFDTLTW